MASNALRRVKEKAELKGDETQHEQTDSWSNRDLIPLPPSRRTWGTFHYFGYWAISSLNVTNWQLPNTYLTEGLSVAQAMVIIVVGRFIITLFCVAIAWCGLEWHIGFTVQNRFTWGMRGSWIPLLQRILLNFMWTALQCWNGGRLVTVCLSAIWPSFATMKNTLSSDMPTTTNQFVGFIVFWCISVPFVFIRPEKFKLPFQIVSIYCAVAMIAMMIWALSVAKGVGPIFTQGEDLPTGSTWNSSWLIMAGINQLVGGIVTGISNGSDFSRYAKDPKRYIIGTIVSMWLVGTMVSFIGLVTTGACQKIYGEVYWNPPDLMMVMMDNGKGSSKSRAGVFFLAAGMALAGMFENICGNTIAGGIDLAGLFPRYINIQRGAIITFMGCWIFQPWQLINRATTFIEVLEGFGIFLSGIIGVMFCDYFLIRRRKVELSHLYRTKGSNYWYWNGINLRVLPAWILSWAPTIGGLIVTVGNDSKAPRGLLQIYNFAFFPGFVISVVVFYVTMRLFPVDTVGQFDEIDYYGAFTEKEAEKLGIARLSSTEILEQVDDSIEQIQDKEKGPKTQYIIADGAY